MKTTMVSLAVLTMTFLSACSDVPYTELTGGAPEDLTELPEEVLAMAAPHQDLTAVRIQPDDGCYWYRWVGPVETTYLPVRMADGRQICARG